MLPRPPTTMTVPGISEEAGKPQTSTHWPAPVCWAIEDGIFRVKATSQDFLGILDLCMQERKDLAGNHRSIFCLRTRTQFHQSHGEAQCSCRGFHPADDPRILQRRRASPVGGRYCPLRYGVPERAEGEAGGHDDSWRLWQPEANPTAPVSLVKHGWSAGTPD